MSRAQTQGIMVVPLHLSGCKKSDRLQPEKPKGPFRNMKAVRNWIGARIHSAKAFDVLTPSGETLRLEGQGE